MFLFNQQYKLKKTLEVMADFGVWTLERFEL